ncbi:MAG: TadE/TadG family type IV pilus assembly protein [Eubacteriales bacterium]|nr:TadE/TadG family type IV pilus assembly protein [Eubacteriales bacterium]MDD4323453.1 TadE/TadG family type IV pilus assembly protein [Eubacteriales bacterium]MDD4540692.1 TadE/TadG family type IV pilus assembly protein [Eubacteriales bacterium]
MRAYRVWKREEGQTLVEFALILPLLLLLLVAVIDFGWIFFAKLMVNNTTREVARIYAVYDDAVVNEFMRISSAEDLALERVSSPNVFINDAANATTAEVKVDKTSAEKPEIRVTISGKVKPLIGLFFRNNVPVSSTTYMRIEYRLPVPVETG